MESLRVTVSEIWPGQNRGRKKEKIKKIKNYEANWMVSNSAKLDRRTKQHTQFGVSASNGSRDMTRTKSWRKKRKKKEKNNEANWMVSNSAKLDRRTKQHTESGVSTSDGSRVMGRTRSWRKKKKKKEKRKKKELEESHKASPMGIANNNETGSRLPCMRPRSDPPKMKNSTPDKIVAEKKKYRS